MLLLSLSNRFKMIKQLFFVLALLFSVGHKDENGSWADSPEYWVLIVTKDKKLKYEFGRFRCGISDEE